MEAIKYFYSEYEIVEDNDALKLYIEIPGFEKEDIEIKYTHPYVKIKTKNKNILNASYELTFFTELEPKNATLKNGILCLEFKTKSKKITIK